MIRGVRGRTHVTYEAQDRSSQPIRSRLREYFSNNYILSCSLNGYDQLVGASSVVCTRPMNNISKQLHTLKQLTSLYKTNERIIRILLCLFTAYLERERISKHVCIDDTKESVYTLQTRLYVRY